MRAIVFALVAMLTAAPVLGQGVAGLARHLTVGRSTVSAIPAASSGVFGLWLVTDDADCSPATADDGVTLCLDAGATWVPAGGGGAAQAHAVTHELGGDDELDLTGLPGVLAEPQTPAVHTQAANTISDSSSAGRALLTAIDAATQRTALGLDDVLQRGGVLGGQQCIGGTADADDLRFFANTIDGANAAHLYLLGDESWEVGGHSGNSGVYGISGETGLWSGAHALAVTAAGGFTFDGVTVPVTTDPRFSDARTPTAHATSHKHGGSDEVATATAAANAIPKAGSGGTLAAGWIPTLNQDTTGNAATASAFDHNPPACAASSFVTDQSAAGALTCSQPNFTDLAGAATDAQVTDTITASLYAPLAGATFTGPVAIDNAQGFKLFEADANGSNFFAFTVAASLTGDTTCTIGADGKIPDSCVGDGTDGGGALPAGTGSELNARLDATTFQAVPGSSVATSTGAVGMRRLVLTDPSTKRMSTLVIAPPAGYSASSSGNDTQILVCRSPGAVTITRSGSTATVTPVSGGIWGGGNTTGAIFGADQEEYNGFFNLTRVGGGPSYSYTVQNSPTTPATGTMWGCNQATFIGNDAIGANAFRTKNGGATGQTTQVQVDGFQGDSPGDGEIAMIGPSRLCWNSGTSSSGQAGGGDACYRRTRVGSSSFASGNFSALADAQTVVGILRRSTTNATPAELFLDGSSTRMVLPNDTTWTFDCTVVARRTDADGESAGYKLVGVIDRQTNAASTALVGTVTTTVIAEDNAAWDVTATADTTNGALVITVTNEAGKTVRSVSRCETTEVTG